MKKLAKAIVTVLLIQAFIGCEVDELKIKDENEFYVKRIKVNNDKVLQGLISQLSIRESSNGRTAEQTMEKFIRRKPLKSIAPKTIPYDILF